MRGVRAAVLVWVALAACRRDGETPRTSEGGPPDGAVPAASYVGSQRCGVCHAVEHERWRGSDHARAMQVATDATVLGDFQDAELEHFGVRTTFARRDGRFVVRTPGPDGAPGEFEVAYTFGVDPLQQYLVAFPDGRLQALPFAWDTRPAAAGGGRWFHLHPDEPIPPSDELYWTKRLQNWNFTCAECHSTALARGYDERTDRYDTKWQEIDVGCEACHGPGSRHAAWAESRPAGAGRAVSTPSAAEMGLLVDLADRSGGQWMLEPERGIARRSAAPRPDHALDVCGRCHARRRPLGESALAAGGPRDESAVAFLDTHVPALLTQPLYQADGQILDEVFEYGSFLQSRMAAAGVRCTDCHDPHSAGPHAPGNALCARCHDAARFDTPAHHHHPQGGPGARCVDCHMPARTYMVVDPRRDHGFRVPRPDLARDLGTRDACLDCHADRDSRWSARVVDGWLPAGGPERAGRDAETQRARAFHAARRGDALAGVALLDVALDTRQPAVARATALEELARFPAADAPARVAAALSSAEGLVRQGAVRALEPYPWTVRAPLLAPLLRDTLRAVRIEAARVLGDLASPAASKIGESSWPAAARADLTRALAELEASERASIDTPEARYNLGLLRERRGDDAGARAHYESALALDPTFAPAAANLADAWRRAGHDEKGEEVLRAALARAPRAAALRHALGLLLVRRGARAEACGELARAADLAPQDDAIVLALALTLRAERRPEEALGALRAGLEHRPQSLALLQQATETLRELHRPSEALDYARRWSDLDPQGAREAVSTLELEVGH